MNCYLCDELRRTSTAVALCHYCSAALCHEHALSRPRMITMIAPLNREVRLPIEAREFLCAVCKQALEQPRRAA